MGVGIRNMRVFNIALLGKWEWKVKYEVRGIWYITSVNIYGLTNNALNSESIEASRWWKDTYQLELGGGENSNEYLMKDMYKSLSSDDQPRSKHYSLKVWNKVIP